MKIQKTPRELRDEYLHGLDDKLLACRGDHHVWPQMKVGRVLPRGMSAVRQRDGCFQLRQRCSNCGMVRTKMTLPGGRWDLDAGWVYTDKPRGYAAPKGSEITRLDAVAELGRRIQDAITATGDAS